MTRARNRDPRWSVLSILALALAAGAGSAPVARAQGPGETATEYWHIPIRAYTAAWEDSTVLKPGRCESSFRGPLADSLRPQARTVTLRFTRSPQVEARPDFGGYRIYRVTSNPDTGAMVLIRRFSLNDSVTIDNLGNISFPLWHFSRVDPATLEFVGIEKACKGQPAYDNIITFVDPDSVGNYQKVCRITDHLGRCLSIGDSIWKLVAPAGPHDGFRTWYSITYEARNTIGNTYEDLYVPDSSDAAYYSAHGFYPNLNNKLANMISTPVVPSAPQAQNTEGVHVVPNPFRGSEAWDPAGGNMVEFTNLPDHARIRIFTVTGELVRELNHGVGTPQPLLGGGTCEGCEAWDLKNDRSQDVSSGIYIYRVESGNFSAQGRFIVIR